MVHLNEYGSFVASHTFMPECTDKGVLLLWGNRKGSPESKSVPHPLSPIENVHGGRLYIFYTLWIYSDLFVTLFHEQK